jgi:hypothetical protein
LELGNANQESFQLLAIQGKLEALLEAAIKLQPCNQKKSGIFFLEIF